MAVFNILHITKYQYNFAVKESSNEIRLFPHNFENQDVLHYDLMISHYPEVTYSNDYHGNKVGHFNILEAHDEMIIQSKMLVRINHSLKIPEIDDTKVSAIDLHNDIYLLRLSYPEKIKKQAEIEAILKEIHFEEKSIIDIAYACNQYVFNNFEYTKGITNVETTVDEILGHKKGVCQDFAHVLLQLLRTAGIPSRYVSGYICPNESGMRGEGATHAWVEIYTPKQGWLGIDPTNNIWTMDNHVKLSVGMNFKDCSPAKGSFKGLAQQTLSVSVQIGYEDGRHIQEINDVALQKNSVVFELQSNHTEQQQQ
ncbi:transglutaminase family protein [Flavobacterium flavipallidum]|uniref:Transglutaminase family protein n=1 Tax=Flavobacterium flavipallidum TaxID=3139140 RepID=A0ABU9HP05_9FLAO